MRGFISIFTIIFLLSVTLVALGGVELYESHLQDNKTPHTDASTERTIETKTFYIKPLTANVRICPNAIAVSEEFCPPVATAKQNTKISLPYQTISDMPQWVSFTWEGKNAYISKTVLSETVTATKSETTRATSVTSSNPLNEAAKSIEEWKNVPEPSQEQLNKLVWLCNVAVSDIDCSINFYDSYYHDLVFRAEIDTKIAELENI